MGYGVAKNLLIAWMIIAVMLYAFLPSRKATIGIYIGWLFLPCLVMVEIKGLFKIDKGIACGLAILIGTIIFDSNRLLSLRPKWFDLPVIAMCFSPFFTSISNDLGAYDGLSAVRDQFGMWGMHYLIGRMYFSDLAALGDLARGIFYAGLVYVPLCWIEIRMSPQLHAWVYGFLGNPRFDEELRAGGYRPTVFLSHGLELGMFMCLVSLLAVWLWRTRAVKTVFGVPMAFIVPIVLVTLVFCKSTNAMLLALLGVLILHFTARKWAFVLVILMLIPPLYCLLRGTKTWNGMEMVQATKAIAGPDRADSVEFRLENEDMLSTKALKRPILGWGGWDRARVFDSEGHDLTVTDGLWIIALGNTGLLGLCLWLMSMMIPTLVFRQRFASRTWNHPAVGGAAVFAIYFVLMGIDCLLNAQPIPFVITAMGGVTGTMMPQLLPGQRAARKASKISRGRGFDVALARPTEAPIANLTVPLAPGDPDSLVARPALPGPPLAADAKAVIP